jgi:hypothetical protein
LRWAELVFIRSEVGLFLIIIQTISLAPGLWEEDSGSVLDAKTLCLFQLDALFGHFVQKSIAICSMLASFRRQFTAKVFDELRYRFGSRVPGISAQNCRRGQIAELRKGRLSCYGGHRRDGK